MNHTDSDIISPITQQQAVRGDIASRVSLAKTDWQEGEQRNQTDFEKTRY